MDLGGIDTALDAFDCDLESLMRTRAAHHCSQGADADVLLEEPLLASLMDEDDQDDGLELPSMDALAAACSNGGGAAAAPRAPAYEPSESPCWHTHLLHRSGSDVSTACDSAITPSLSSGGSRAGGTSPCWPAAVISAGSGGGMLRPGATTARQQDADAAQQECSAPDSRAVLVRQLLARLAAARRSGAGADQQQQVGGGATEPSALTMLSWAVAQHIVATAQQTGAALVAPQQAAAVLAAAGSGGSLPVAVGAAAPRPDLAAIIPQLQLQHSSGEVGAVRGVRSGSANIGVELTITRRLARRQQMRHRVQARLALLQQVCPLGGLGFSTP